MKHNLTIAAVAGRWRLFMVRRQDPAFAKFRDTIFTRDGYTCQFCGFRSKTHQEIVNLDGNFSNNHLDNLVTSCCFCTQCFFLDAVGVSENSGGSLIYLPQMEQQDLNGLCHVLFCAMNDRMAKVHEAQSIYLSLQERNGLVTQYLGQGMDRPETLGKLLINLGEQTRKQLEAEVLPSLRLLPMYTKFKPLVGTWSNQAFKNFVDGDDNVVKEVSLVEKDVEDALIDDLD